MSFLEESQNYINSASEGVSRVNEIMTSMKNFSRRDVEDKSAVSIATCIQNSLNLCNNELKYHVEVITNIPDQLPPVYGIGRQLEQVFINLFHNAGQAMESFKNSGQRGMLSISVQPAGDSLRITVEDSGPGIPEEVSEHHLECLLYNQTSRNRYRTWPFYQQRYHSESPGSYSCRKPRTGWCAFCSGAADRERRAINGCIH